MPKLVTQSWDDYVRIAVTLAYDLPRLAELRLTLRGADAGVATNGCGGLCADCGGCLSVHVAALLAKQGWQWTKRSCHGYRSRKPSDENEVGPIVHGTMSA